MIDWIIDSLELAPAQVAYWRGVIYCTLVFLFPLAVCWILGAMAMNPPKRRKK